MKKFSHVKNALRRGVIEAGAARRISEFVLKLPESATPPHLDSALAQQLSKNGDLKAARAYLERALHSDPHNPEWCYRIAVIDQRFGRYSEAVESFTRAISERDIGKYRYHRAQVYAKLNRTHDAIDDLFRALTSDYPDERAYQILFNLLTNAQITPNERVRYLRLGIDLDLARRDWILHLARTAYTQELTQESITYYRKATLNGDLGSDDSYKFGLSLLRMDRNVEARKHFQIAMKKSSNKRLAFGLGSLHAWKGNWPLAKRYFHEHDTKISQSAELFYQTGMAHDRTYDWAGAEKYYSLALAEEDTHPYWWWRLGFVSERQRKFAQAARFYIQSNRMKPGFNGLYDAGRMYVKSGDVDSALDCFRRLALRTVFKKRSIPLEPTVLDIITAVEPAATTSETAKIDRTVGLALVEVGQYRRAIEYLERAVGGLSSHDRDVYGAYGYALEQCGKVDSALVVYMQMAPVQKPDGVGSSVKIGAAEQLRTRYLAYRQELSVNPKIVLYEVGHGSNIGCNPAAIYRTLRRSSNYGDLKHVWVVKSDTPVPSDVAEDERVIIVERETDLYFRYLATAKYLINNTSFGGYFMRRTDQQYLNTWHGTPFKTLGRAVKNEYLNYGNISRNLLHATHLAVGNQWTADILINEHQVYGLFSGKVFVSGTPRIDGLIRGGVDGVDPLRQRLNLDASRPLVLYAPTWKGSLDGSVDILDVVSEDLRVMAKMEEAGYQVRYSAHRFVYEAGYAEAIGERLISKDEDIYQVVGLADVIVTDYSSIFFDCLPTRKPIIFHAPDLDEYSATRGLYNVDLPGPVCGSVDDLCAVLSDLESVHERFCDAYEAAIGKFTSREDGWSAHRIIDWFFDDVAVEEYPVNKGPLSKYVFRHSFIPNGIAASFRALTRSLAEQALAECYVVVDRDSISSDDERRDQVDLLSPGVRLLPRAGRTLYTVEERWLDAKDKKTDFELSGEQETMLAHAYSREFERLFGPSIVDVACEFDGYSRFWTRVIGDSVGAESKVIYLHNNMIEEQRTKHPELHSVFPRYKTFDALISVSESVYAENRDCLASRYSLGVEKFVWANNVVDATRVAIASRESVPGSYSSFLSRPGVLAVSVGRLSVEKGHDRLIRGLADGPESINLVILGGGPEEENLRSLVSRLSLDERVLITGHLVNPYPIMARADVITLLSRWEGQGLSLLEAMILGCKIVATDIPGPKSVIDSYGGTLVENSDLGIRKALALIGDRQVAPSVFNVEEYNDRALRRFSDAVTGSARGLADRSASGMSMAGQREI